MRLSRGKIGERCKLPCRDTARRCVPARYFALGDGVVADAFDRGLVARGARGQTLVAFVLAQSAAVAGAHIAERRDCRCCGRDGRGRLLRGNGRFGGRMEVPIMGVLLQGAFEVGHRGSHQDMETGRLLVFGSSTSRRWRGPGSCLPRTALELEMRTSVSSKSRRCGECFAGGRLVTCICHVEKKHRQAALARGWLVESWLTKSLIREIRGEPYAVHGRVGVHVMSIQDVAHWPRLFSQEGNTPRKLCCASRTRHHRMSLLCCHVLCS